MSCLRRALRLGLRRELSSSSASAAAEQAELPPPRPSAGRRVVVTGLGAVTPLGRGVGPTWERLVAGGCAVRALAAEDLHLPGGADAGRTLEQLPSRVAAAVPRGKGDAEFDEEAWTMDNKSISGFTAYALCAADEALRDANWLPSEDEKKERTRLRRLSPYFIPKILINMASGHVSMRYGFQALDHAKERGAKIYAEVRGYGMSGDAHHITQPQNDGRGATLAMKRALDQSGLQADQIDYLNAHATSTPLGDAVEANAIKSVFGDHATSGGLALSSTKGIAPPTLNLEKPDPLFEGAFMPLSSPKKMPIRAAISNSFGFGGTNTSLLFSCPP
uniref:beta-ketoacyl-[acyl-carrier-protein] synthase I n=1 Tax=Oryza meridionalis TaxID=40149 RepID=A0A0E0CHA6_9ORYZ